MWLVSSDVLKREASVQNYTEETISSANANLLSASEDSRIPSNVIGPSGEGKYLIFVDVQV